MFQVIVRMIEGLIGLGLILSFGMILLTLVCWYNSSNFIHDTERVLLTCVVIFTAFLLLAWRRKESFLWLFVWL
jgi:hypothetical protein